MPEAQVEKTVEESGNGVEAAPIQKGKQGVAHPGVQARGAPQEAAGAQQVQVSPSLGSKSYKNSLSSVTFKSPKKKPPKARCHPTPIPKVRGGVEQVHGSE